MSLCRYRVLIVALLALHLSACSIRQSASTRSESVTTTVPVPPQPDRLDPGRSPLVGNTVRLSGVLPAEQGGSDAVWTAGFWVIVPIGLTVFLAFIFGY